MKKYKIVNMQGDFPRYMIIEKDITTNTCNSQILTWFKDNNGDIIKYWSNYADSGYRRFNMYISELYKAVKAKEYDTADEAREDLLILFLAIPCNKKQDVSMYMSNLLYDQERLNLQDVY